MDHTQANNNDQEEKWNQELSSTEIKKHIKQQLSELGLSLKYYQDPEPLPNTATP